MPPPCPHHVPFMSPLCPHHGPTVSPCPQCENSSSMRWQLALYRAMAGKAEDSDSPEKIVRRVQEVSAVLYHLEQVRGGLGGWGGVPEGLLGVSEGLLGVSGVLLGGLQMSMGVSGML